MNSKIYPLVVVALLSATTAFSRTSHLQSLYPNEFELKDVTITQGPFLHSMNKNIEVLKAYDVDRLLAPFYTEAGLEPKAPRFENWAGLDGHVAGHYITALAIHYADTGDEELLATLNSIIDQLEAIQKANGDGYVGGVPDSEQCWTDLRNGDVTAISKRWVPWYNLHKLYAGLRDAYTYAGSEKARTIFLNLCDWGIEVISHLDDQQMERMLDTEFGGMNEVYADAYDLTGDEKYLDAAIRFSHHWLLDSMVDGVDNLDNRHANTQVPKAVGYQRVAEMCEKAGRKADADKYAKAARFFWHTVADTRSLAIGGNSRREYFPSAADCISYSEEKEGPESCNTNNMLKLTEGLFRMSPDAHYADFYERAMYNHILSTQHPEHGGYVYFTSARPGHYRVYSQPNSAMWCCVGTGMENHGKYSQFIYTHKADTLRVNLFVPSEVKWNGLKLVQTTDFPDSEESVITVETKKAKQFAIKVRKPFWCNEFSVSVNGRAVNVAPSADGYVCINRTWRNGDQIEISLPMSLRLEEMPNVPQYVAIMRGPILLGAMLGNDDMDDVVAGEDRWGHIASGRMYTSDEVPVLIGNRQEILDKLNNMKRIPGEEMAYKVEGLFDGKFADLTLRPFANIHDHRYMMYWLNLTPEEWAKRQDEIKAREAEMLRIESITVDAVNFGEQQPEVDHNMQSENSIAGNYQGQSYRHAENGWFSCVLDTKGEKNLALMATYWGNESGGRTFDILVDGEVLTTCANKALSGKSEFVDRTYAIPREMVEGKSTITVKFAAHPHHTAGGVYNLRLIKTDN